MKTLLILFALAGIGAGCQREAPNPAVPKTYPYNSNALLPSGFDVSRFQIIAGKRTIMVDTATGASWVLVDEEMTGVVGWQELPHYVRETKP